MATEKAQVAAYVDPSVQRELDEEANELGLTRSAYLTMLIMTRPARRTTTEGSPR